MRRKGMRGKEKEKEKGDDEERKASIVASVEQQRCR